MENFDENSKSFCNTFKVSCHLKDILVCDWIAAMFDIYLAPMVLEHLSFPCVMGIWIYPYSRWLFCDEYFTKVVPKVVAKHTMLVAYWVYLKHMVTLHGIVVWTFMLKLKFTGRFEKMNLFRNILNLCFPSVPPHLISQRVIGKVGNYFLCNFF